MTNAVSSVGRTNILTNKYLDTCVQKDASVIDSVFDNKTASKGSNDIEISRMPKLEEIPRNEIKDNSFFCILKRIGKGAFSGISHLFETAFECPPMAMATGAILLALSASSTSSFALTLAILLGVLLGGALSGITSEFQNKKEVNKLPK